jgi:hypothetical protein
MRLTMGNRTDDRDRGRGAEPTMHESVPNDNTTLAM